MPFIIFYAIYSNISSLVVGLFGTIESIWNHLDAETGMTEKKANKETWLKSSTLTIFFIRFDFIYVWNEVNSPVALGMTGWR
jgi:hypothetical protein